MKKLYTTPEYKSWHKRRLLKIAKKLRKKVFEEKRFKRTGKRKKKDRVHQDIKSHVLAPYDLRLLENLEGCLSFFRDLRSEEYLSRRGSIKFIIMSLKNVTDIDYGTISILTAINDDLKFKGIILKTISPDNPACKQFMFDAGYFNNLFDEKGKMFPRAPKSELIFFEKGSGRLSENDSRRIALLIKNVVGHLTGTPNYCLPIRTLILEVCGNSIEWSGTESKQWLLGVKYEENNVIFTVTDVGKGILDSLYRRLTKKFFDTFKNSEQILSGAFDKKYESSTREENRNKGLPGVKAYFKQGAVNSLKVLTNNVILHFDNDSLSHELEKGSPRFRGTFYQWEMTKDCLTKLITA
jgi:hypothetical protein